MPQPQKCKFLEKETKAINITILNFITTFLNFALRIQTGGATKVLKYNSQITINLRKNVTTN